MRSEKSGQECPRRGDSSQVDSTNNSFSLHVRSRMTDGSVVQLEQADYRARTSRSSGGSSGGSAVITTGRCTQTCRRYGEASSLRVS